MIRYTREMESEIHHVLQSYVYPSLISAFGALAVFGLTLLSRWLQSKVKDDRAQSMIQRLTTLALNAVLEQEQIRVKPLKANGEWDPANQSIVKDRAKGVVLRHLGDKGMKQAKVALGHKDEGGEVVIDGMVDTLIEAAVAEIREK